MKVKLLVLRFSWSDAPSGRTHGTLFQILNEERRIIYGSWWTESWISHVMFVRSSSGWWNIRLWKYVIIKTSQPTVSESLCYKQEVWSLTDVILMLELHSGKCRIRSRDCKSGSAASIVILIINWIIVHLFVCCESANFTEVLFKCEIFRMSERCL